MNLHLVGLGTKTCETCEAVFMRKRAHGSDAAWAIVRFCSRKCFGIARRTHGHSLANTPTATYRAWANMHTRCENPNSTQYKWYGGRGITVDARWHSYEQFLADVGERPTPKHSLDRHPNSNGNYEPGNVRWATQSEQCRNKRGNRPVVRGDGLHFPTMADAAESVAGGSVREIWAICNGRGKTHRGHSWRYA